jgi:ABC-type Fe3+/spermidine/putrescine transport system ATPase subunit
MQSMYSVGIALELRGLTVTYQAIPVLRQVDLQVSPGGTLAVIGPSGSGKSTLLRCVAGFLAPAAGMILFDDNLVASPTTAVPPERRQVGFVFQNFALWPHMSVRDNVAYPWKVRGVRRQQRRQYAEAALARVGLSGLGDRSPSQLSGGQQQRVALARALAGEPRLLLLDEPLSSVDVALRDELQHVIAKLVAETGVTMVVATHDRDEAAALADRIAVLDQGVVVQVGTPLELHDQPANPFVAQFMGATNLFNAIVAGRDRSGAVTALASPGHASRRGDSRAVLTVVAAEETVPGGVEVGRSDDGLVAPVSDEAGGIEGPHTPATAGAQMVVAVVWPDQVRLGEPDMAGLPGVVTRVSLRAGHREVTVQAGDFELRAWEENSRPRVAGERVTVTLGRVRLFCR